MKLHRSSPSIFVDGCMILKNAIDPIDNAFLHTYTYAIPLIIRAIIFYSLDILSNQ
jgi:hypothetical protein